MCRAFTLQIEPKTITDPPKIKTNSAPFSRWSLEPYSRLMWVRCHYCGFLHLVSLTLFYAVKQEIVDSIKELYLIVPSQLMEIPAVINYS